MMRNLLHFSVSIFVACSIAACATRQQIKPYNVQKTQHLYSLSIGDAAKPQAWEIDSHLISIREDNPNLVWKEIKGVKYILVSTWKADTIYYKNDPQTGKYNSGNYPIWVTTAPEVQNKCQNNKFGRREGLDLRLKQLFGLPPNVEKKYFIEFWVRPSDLFRPCPDREITNNSCDLAFPPNASVSYINWINGLRIDSYYHAEWDKNFPWTQLGYTYDWNPKTKRHIGLSEFIIDQNSEIVVHAFYTTQEYCLLDMYR